MDDYVAKIEWTTPEKKDWEPLGPSQPDRVWLEDVLGRDGILCVTVDYPAGRVTYRPRTLKLQYRNENGRGGWVMGWRDAITGVTDQDTKRWYEAMTAYLTQNPSLEVMVGYGEAVTHYRVA